MPNSVRGRSGRVYGSALRLGLDAAGGKIVEGLGRLKKKKKVGFFSQTGLGLTLGAPMGAWIRVVFFLRSRSPVECECELTAVT